MLCKRKNQPGFEVQVLQEWAYLWSQHAATFRHAENSERCLWNRRALFTRVQELKQATVYD